MYQNRNGEVGRVYGFTKGSNKESIPLYRHVQVPEEK